MESGECLQSSTIKLDWIVRGLKQLFESSKGDSKSKVTKSMKFGDGRWQILFYANSGTDSGGFVSLYLSYEPTTSEKENAVGGRWVHEGKYKFSFEIRNLAKTVLFGQKEANDHEFSWKTANWGWAQFCRRESVYYHPNVVRHQDAFLITCSITSSPSAPSAPSTIPHRSVPKSLLDSVGSLLDDPTYSDVVFFICRPGAKRCTTQNARRIYAARTILERADYFNAMFHSGFLESANPCYQLSVGSQSTGSLTPVSRESDSDPERSSQVGYEDSDEEDEDSLADAKDTDDREDPIEVISGLPLHEGQPANSSLPMAMGDQGDGASEDADAVSSRNVRAKLAYPSSPQARPSEMEDVDSFRDTETLHEEALSIKPAESIGPTKMKVVVNDVAYTTYKAVLFYLYTDNILFAPLASSFLSTTPRTPIPLISSQPITSRSPSEGQNLPGNPVRISQTELDDSGPSSRRAWLKDWERSNPGRILPCSAKAVYRIADKLGLNELKARAFQHLVKSLTVDNVPYEMFSSFSATFEEIRKMQIDYFLANWNEIRTSDSMKNVWQQIRVGRHPGFEEVWPLIAMNLEFKPRMPDAADGDNREATEA